MFRRRNRKQVTDQRAALLVEQHALEITQLKATQAELEQILRQMLSASDEFLVEERERRVSTATPGFAEAWLRSDPPTAGCEDFFAVAEVDMRARNWLLASN